MNTISIWAAISVLLSVFHLNGAAPGSAPLVKLASYHIFKKPIHTVSDKFLSFTADPTTISHVAECSLNNSTLNMAKSLTPAYFRLAGADSNHFVFQSNPNVNHSELATKPKIFSVSNENWLQLNNFLSKTGMNVIASVSGVSEPTNKDWDLSNTLELITFSAKHNMSLDWQLGYELQKLTSPDGKQMGRDVTRLRKILDVFPRYRKSLIIGPDMTSFKSKNDAIFVRNYLTEAGDSLNVFTWHPFAKKSEDNEILEMLSNGMNSMDNYLWIKDGLMKSSSKGVVPRKEIWIAESESTETVSNLTDSMTMLMRMGSAARLGASVYLRKPHLLSFYEPTPEFWTSVLYKSLVGRTVLDIKQTAGNGTNKVHLFTHCTKFIEKPEESIINPEILYEPGSITVYGVNMASESTRISFKIGVKGDETAHLYILTQDNSNADFPKTLLNRQPLGLSAENELPLISPRVRDSPKYLLIPARSIFFVVFPNTKCRSCMEHEQPDAFKTKTKILEEEDLDTSTFTSNVLEAIDEDDDHNNVYVSYPKRTENGLQLSSDPSSKSSINGNKMDQSNPQMNVKYVTFSDETWLNPFPEKFKDVVNKEKDGSYDVKDKNKAGMYRVLAQAMLGKRTSPNTPKESPKAENPATRFVFEDESESNQFKRALKYPSRSRRSSESAPNGDEPIPDGNDETIDMDFHLGTLESDNIYLYEGTGNTETSWLRNLAFSNLTAILLPEDFDIKEDTLNDMIPTGVFFKTSTLENMLKTATNQNSIDIKNQTLVLYVHDVQENGNEWYKNLTHLDFPSKLDMTMFNDDNYKQVINDNNVNDVVYTTVLFKKSTFINLLKTDKSRTKREISNENSTGFQESANLTSSASSSMNNLTAVNSTLNSTDMNDPIDKIMDHLVKLVQLFLSLDSAPRPQEQSNGLNNTTGSKTPGKIYRVLTLSMLNKKNTPNVFQYYLEKSEKPVTRFKLDEDVETDEFKKALKDFDRFKRSPQSTPDSKLELKDEVEELTFGSNDMIEPEQNIMKRKENSESEDITSYSSDEQDDLETHKRSASSKVYAVPLTEDGVREAMRNGEFRETIPIVTFIRKHELNGIVGAANDRIKREAVTEDAINLKVPDDLTPPTSTPSADNSSNQTNEKITTTSQTTPKEEKTTTDSSNDMIEQVDKLLKEVKNQSSNLPKLNLQQINSSLPDLIMASSGPEVSRGLREVEDAPETGDNNVGHRHLKTIEKSNTRPVSPFPKKPKNGKSKSVKAIKGQSSDNVQLPHQTAATSSTSSPSTESIVSSKRETPEVVSSIQIKSAEPAKEAAASADDDSEDDDLTKDLITTTSKFQSEITKNLQDASQTTQSKQIPTEEVVSSKLEDPALKEVVSKPISPLNESNQSSSSGVENSDTVGGPHKKLFPLDTSKRNRAKSIRPLSPSVKKPKVTPEQLRLSYEQKRKELMQKRLVRLNELRNMLNMPSIPQSRLHKREANMFTDAFDSTKSFLSEWWENLRSWDPKEFDRAEKTEDDEEPESGRNKRQVKQDANGLFFIYSGNPSNKTVAGPQVYSAETIKQLRERAKASLRDDYPKAVEIEAMRARANQPRNRFYRDLHKTMEKFNELKEQKQTHANEHRQKLNKHIEEMKQKISHHASRISHRNKRDLQAIQDKIHEMKEKHQTLRDELRQKLAKNIEDIKQRSSHHKPIFANRNKRDVQSIQDKIHELKEKYQALQDELQQILAKNIEEIKQRSSQHKPIFADRNKRDVQSIQDKINELKEKNQALRDELRQKLAKDIEEIKHRSSHHKPIFANRNKRDAQSIQDKINEARKKKQEHRQEMRKKFENEHPAPQVAPKMKSKPSKIDEPRNQAVDQARSDERPAPQIVPKLKIKPSKKIDEPQHQTVDPVKTDEHPTPHPQTISKLKIKPVKTDDHHKATHTPAKTDEPRHHAVDPPAKLEEPNRDINSPAKSDESHHQATNPPAKSDESHHQATIPAATKIDKPQSHREVADKLPRKIHKPASTKEKSHRVHKREQNENQLEEKVTSPTDLQKDLQFRLFADPELNTPQSMLEDGNFDELDRLRRSISNNEIFDEDDETAPKIKNKDQEGFHFPKFNKMDNFIKEKTPSASTFNPLTDMKNGNSKIEIAPENSGSSQSNQTCQLTNYNVFKYLWCVAHRLWYTYIRA
ncbi:kinesin-related protein 4-like [Planococcus citri]|uniref:kinesin-related protein 4-like n=1 Tax=Planococcus citri TaxID=170843 RepID=UPI0031F72313